MKLLYIVLLIAFASCSRHNRSAADIIELQKNDSFVYNSIEEYYSTHKTQHEIVDKKWIEFHFMNNPYGLNDNNIIGIYINEYPVYQGEFSQRVILKGDPKQIFAESNSIKIVLQCLTDKNKSKLYLEQFMNKWEFEWKSNYKIIYCCFLPTNESVEKIFFIPHEEIAY